MAELFCKNNQFQPLKRKTEAFNGEKNANFLGSKIENQEHLSLRQKKRLNVKAILLSKILYSNYSLSGFGYQKEWDQIVENFDVYLRAKKSTSSLPSFLRYCKGHCKFVILSTLGMSGYAHQKQQYQLQEPLMHICMQKNQLNFLFFLEILYFKEPSNLIDP